MCCLSDVLIADPVHHHHYWGHLHLCLLSSPVAGVSTILNISTFGETFKLFLMLFLDLQRHNAASSHLLGPSTKQSKYYICTLPGHETMPLPINVPPLLFSQICLMNLVVNSLATSPGDFCTSTVIRTTRFSTLYIFFNDLLTSHS